MLPNTTTFKPEDRQFPSVGVTLKWRQKQLLVSRAHSSRQPYLPPIRSEEWLVECLERSPVKLLQVDASLGEESLNLWANASEKAKKPVFLRLPSVIRQKPQRSLSSWLYQLLDWSLAALLLVVLSPVMVGLIFLLRRRSPEPIFSKQWHVGKRGKLFLLFKFRTKVVDSQTHSHELKIAPELLSPDNFQPAYLENWMYKYKLDKLPQLFNVLRGETSLIELRHLTLKQAVQLSLEKRQPNTLLGIKGA
jgi:lipopolysaccharide/colanic/teichoic acid biosynthesis glycosyltransferase